MTGVSIERRGGLAQEKEDDRNNEGGGLRGILRDRCSRSREQGARDAGDPRCTSPMLRCISPDRGVYSGDGAHRATRSGAVAGVSAARPAMRIGKRTAGLTGCPGRLWRFGRLGLQSPPHLLARPGATRQRTAKPGGDSARGGALRARSGSFARAQWRAGDGRHVRVHVAGTAGGVRPACSGRKNVRHGASQGASGVCIRKEVYIQTPGRFVFVIPRARVQSLGG